MGWLHWGERGSFVLKPSFQETPQLLHCLQDRPIQDLFDLARITMSSLLVDNVPEKFSRKPDTNNISYHWGWDMAPLVSQEPAADEECAPHATWRKRIQSSIYTTENTLMANKKLSHEALTRSAGALVRPNGTSSHSNWPLSHLKAFLGISSSATRICQKLLFRSKVVKTSAPSTALIDPSRVVPSPHTGQRG